MRNRGILCLVKDAKGVLQTSPGVEQMKMLLRGSSHQWAEQGTCFCIVMGTPRGLGLSLRMIQHIDKVAARPLFEVFFSMKQEHGMYP